MNYFHWTHEKIREAMRMHEDGMTFQQIGDHFGITRCAVVGKIHREQRRLGLRHPIKSSGTVEKRQHTKREAIPTLPTVGFILPAVSIRLSSGHGVSIIEVTGCKWPVKETSDVIGGFAFCNAEKSDHRYCTTHRAVAKGIAAPVAWVNRGAA